MRRLLTGVATLALGTLPVAADEFVVQLEGTAFVYNSQMNTDIDLTISPGDTVRWVWVSGLHNVVSGMPGDPDAGVLFRSGDPVLPPMEFAFTFTDPGTYPYHCHQHSAFGMVSTVVVADDCPPDFNGDGTVNSQDFIAFLNAFTAQDPSADFNGDGTINSQDFIAFLNAFVAGC